MASQGVNKVLIIGNLGNDPELRSMPNGKAVCNLSVATSESWKDKQSGETKQKTEWHRITMYDKLAEIAGQYLKKGSKAYFEGKLQTRKWQAQDGTDRYTTEIVADSMQMLDGKQDDAQRQGSQSAQPQPARRQPAQQQPAPLDDFDDDIDF